MSAASRRPLPLLAGLLIAACSPTVPIQSSTATDPPNTVAPTAARSPEPSPDPTAIAEIPLGELRPRPRLVPDATVVCDPYPDQYGNEYGETSIYCEGDVVRLAAAAIQRVTNTPIQRLYLDRSECPFAPCTQEQLNIVTVHVWTTDSAWSMRFDYLAGTVSFPAPVIGDPWPTHESTTGPEVERPAFSDAPREIRARAAMPFCGRTKNTGQPEVDRCFRDAVLDGRAAEMINLATPLDFGSRGLYIWRFEGSGAILQYLRYEGVWSRGSLFMILNPPGSFNSFSPHGDGEDSVPIS